MPEAYTGSLSVPNDYRCFVLDPHLTKPMYLTGYEVTPGVRTEIHHSQVFHQNAEQAARSRARSGQDGKPGWSCYSSPEGVSARRGGGGGFSGQSGLVAGWVPGQDPTIFPEHSGVLLQPGDVLVHQIHYHYDTTPVPDRTTISLQLDPVSSKVRQLRVVNPIAPVEIPCMPGETAALCDRTAALADNAKLYGPFGSAVEGGLLGLCGKTQAELAGRFQNGIASSDCMYSVPESGTIVGVLGHEHTLGRSFRLTLDPGTPQEKILLDIPTWNFDWQMNYQLETPIHVQKGQKLKMECTWDRSLDPNRAPEVHRVRRGHRGRDVLRDLRSDPRRPEQQHPGRGREPLVPVARRIAGDAQGGGTRCGGSWPFDAGQHPEQDESHHLEQMGGLAGDRRAARSGVEHTGQDQSGGEHGRERQQRTDAARPERREQEPGGERDREHTEVARLVRGETSAGAEQLRSCDPGLRDGDGHERDAQRARLRAGRAIRLDRGEDAFGEGRWCRGRDHEAGAAQTREVGLVTPARRARGEMVFEVGSLDGQHLAVEARRERDARVVTPHHAIFPPRSAPGPEPKVVHERVVGRISPAWTS